MSLEQIITLAGAGGFLGTGALICAGASWYDIQEVRRQRRLTAHPHSRILRRRPVVTILIPAGEQPGLTACLESIAAGRYRNYEIIVLAPDRSRFLGAGQAIAAFQRRHPKKAIRLSRKATKQSYAGPVAVLDGIHRVGPDAISGAIRRLAIDVSAQVVVGQPALPAQPSLSSLVRRCRRLAANQLYKAMDAAGRSAWVASKAPVAVYRPGAYLAQRPHKAAKTAVKSGLALAAASLSLYGFYLAAAAITSDLLAILWGAALLFLLLAIWDDKSLDLVHKLRLSLLAPPATILLYISFLSAPLRGASRRLSGLFS